MMLEPYFENGNTSVPLPHVRLVQSVLQEREYYSDIEKTIVHIISEPVYFLFADPLAFSEL